MKDLNRQFWNQQQKKLRNIILQSNRHEEAIKLFLNQHAMVHSKTLTKTELWSFEDELWKDMTEDVFRRIPKNEIHSIAWNLLHATRIEDITMNLLVAGDPQIFNSDNYLEKMKITVCDTCNALKREDVEALSSSIDIKALKRYRLAVGKKTREIAKMLQPEELNQKVDTNRLQQVLDEGAVVESQRWLTNYWGKRNVAGLLLMPATRHNFVHLNKARQLKNKRS